MPPRIAPFSFEQSVFAGVSTQVTCLMTEGELPADIFWLFNGKRIIPKDSSSSTVSTNKVGSKTSLLLIESTSAEHRGNYTCVVRNDAGSTEYVAVLNINGNHHSVCALLA